MGTATWKWMTGGGGPDQTGVVGSTCIMLVKQTIHCTEELHLRQEAVH